MSILARAEVAFTPATWSKNRGVRRGKGGVLYVPEAVKRARLGLALLLRSSMTSADRAAIQGRKLWVNIVVTKKDRRTDAVNVIDGVCDAVQAATGLDDRWYTVRCDWEIGDRPRIVVELSLDAP